MAQALQCRIRDGLYRHVGEAAGFAVSGGSGKRSQRQRLASPVGSGGRGLRRSGLDTLLFSNESFIEVCSQKKKLVDQILLRFQEGKAGSA